MNTDLRKRRFRAALALSGMTARDFAGLHAWTDQHLSLVLSGKRTSAPVVKAVERFIATVQRKHEAA